MNTIDAIKSKRAIRNFNSKRIPTDLIKTIVNAGRLAQSAKNTQPWNFIVIQDAKILAALSELGHFAKHIAGATMAIAIITPPPEERFSILFDAGQSAAYMQLAAWELGIGSCLATIYEPEQAKTLLNIPDTLHINIAISFGYPLEEELPPRRPNTTGRRNLSQVLHWDKWEINKN